MMELELKHLTPYLPYNLEVITEDNLGKEKDFIIGLGIIDDCVYLDKKGDWYYNDENEFNCKPILRPLSDLTKEIEHNGEKFIPYDKLLDGSMLQYTEDIRILRYGDVEKLLEWHFDINNLIDQNLAININTIE